MSNKIHQTAIISNKAEIASDVEIGPYCVIHDNVKIESGTKLCSHVVIDGYTTIGKNNTIFPFASIGSSPQDLKYEGERSEVIIGDNNIIREYTTINPGTKGGGLLTKIGSNCLFMMSSHIAHDCIVGNNVILANNATLAGHVVLGDFVIIGGLSAIHQFVRIGDHAMIGGMSAVEKDVIPFGTVMGERASLVGLNLIGLKRRNFDREELSTLREVYYTLFEPKNSTLSFEERIAAVKAEYSHYDTVSQLVRFLEKETSRSFCMPRNLK